MLKLAAQAAAPGMLQVVLMGLITVFVVLVCLIGIIKLLGLAMEKFGGKSAPQTAAAPAASKAAVPAPQAAGGNQQIVAAIATAIAEDMGSDVDHLKIHSIRKL